MALYKYSEWIMNMTVQSRKEVFALFMSSLYQGERFLKKTSSKRLDR